MSVVLADTEYVYSAVGSILSSKTVVSTAMFDPQQNGLFNTSPWQVEAITGCFRQAQFRVFEACNKHSLQWWNNSWARIFFFFMFSFLVSPPYPTKYICMQVSLQIQCYSHLSKFGIVESMSINSDRSTILLKWNLGIHTFEDIPILPLSYYWTGTSTNKLGPSARGKASIIRLEATYLVPRSKLRLEIGHWRL